MFPLKLSTTENRDPRKLTSNFQVPRNQVKVVYASEPPQKRQKVQKVDHAKQNCEDPGAGTELVVAEPRICGVESTLYCFDTNKKMGCSIVSDGGKSGGQFRFVRRRGKRAQGMRMTMGNVDKAQICSLVESGSAVLARDMIQTNPSKTWNFRNSHKHLYSTFLLSTELHAYR